MAGTGPAMTAERMKHRASPGRDGRHKTGHDRVGVVPGEPKDREGDPLTRTAMVSLLLRWLRHLQPGMTPGMLHGSGMAGIDPGSGPGAATVSWRADVTPAMTVETVA